MAEVNKDILLMLKTFLWISLCLTSDHHWDRHQHQIASVDFDCLKATEYVCGTSSFSSSSSLL